MHTPSIRSILAWALANPTQALAIGSAIFATVRAFWRIISPPIYKRWPRSRPVVESIFALIPFSDIWRAVLKVLEAFTGQSFDPHPEAVASAERISTLNARVSSLAAQLQLAEQARTDAARPEVAPAAIDATAPEHSASVVPPPPSLNAPVVPDAVTVTTDEATSAPSVVDGETPKR